MGSVGSVCGSGSGDVAEMEVRLDVGDDSESNESAEFGFHDVEDYVYMCYAVGMGGVHVRRGCLVLGGVVVVVVSGGVALWWGKYVEWEELGWWGRGGGSWRGGRESRASGGRCNV